MKTGEQKKWRLVYAEGERNAVAFLFAIDEAEAKQKILKDHPSAVFSLVTEDKRDP